MYDLLLTNAVVITMDEKRRVIENGAVGVKDGRIAFVGDSMEADLRQRRCWTVKTMWSCRGLWMPMAMGDTAPLSPLWILQATGCL